MKITRKGTFDAGHRVMHQTQACRFLHGHLYQYELTFDFRETKNIGYAIDFKEIKRIPGEFIEQHFDHGFIANPHDHGVIDLLDSEDSRKWIMSLNGAGVFCNPTAENISKELFVVVDRLMQKEPGLSLENIRLYETPNCFIDCNEHSVSDQEWEHVLASKSVDVDHWRENQGDMVYDDREL